MRVSTHDIFGDCFPAVAALVTGGARLMPALLERLVRDAGGSYALATRIPSPFHRIRIRQLLPMPQPRHRSRLRNRCSCAGVDADSRDCHAHRCLETLRAGRVRFTPQDREGELPRRPTGSTLRLRPLGQTLRNTLRIRKQRARGEMVSQRDHQRWAPATAPRGADLLVPDRKGIESTGRGGPGGDSNARRRAGSI